MHKSPPLNFAGTHGQGWNKLAINRRVPVPVIVVDEATVEIIQRSIRPEHQLLKNECLLFRRGDFRNTRQFAIGCVAAFDDKRSCHSARYLYRGRSMKMGVVPERSGRMIGWNLDFIVLRGAWRYLDKDVVAFRL